MKDLSRYLNKEVRVTIDRPLGSIHPKHPDMIYPINYGYIENTLSGDGKEVDAYIIGEHDVLETFTGMVIGLVIREDDNEDKLIVSKHKAYTRDEMYDAVKFTEQYFKSYITTDISEMEWMHRRLSFINNLAISSKLALTTRSETPEYDHYNMNYIKINNKQYVQSYAIPVITYKQVDIGFNINHVFIEVFCTKEVALKWLNHYTGPFEYEIYGGQNCNTLTADNMMLSDDETIGIALYIPYTTYEIGSLKKWLNRYFEV